MAYHNVFIKALGRLDFSNRWKDAGDFTDKTKKVGTEEFYGVKDTKLYEKQLEYIEKNLKGYSDEVQEWRKNYEAGKTTEAETKAVADVIANALKNHVAVGDGDIQNAKDAIEHAEQAILAAEVEYAKTAQNSD
jgi:vacuolar-type H+-ATPase subunit C/Vma6